MSVKLDEIKTYTDCDPGNGSYTLQERVGSEALFKDGQGELFSNPNVVEFYRAAAKRIAKQSRRYKIRYNDISQ